MSEPPQAAAEETRARVRAVAAWGLPGAPPLPTAPLDDETFRDLLGTCTRERILGALGRAAALGDFVTTPDQLAELETTWQEWLAHAVRVERRLVTVLDALETYGVDTLALKGVALAHTSYGDPSDRVFGDVDLLVRPGQMHAAATALVAVLGGRRAEPEMRPGYDDRFVREVLVEVGGIEIDLHRTLVNGAYGTWIDVEGIFAAAEEIAIAARRVRVPGAADRALHAAYGFVLSDWPPRLGAARDLARIVASDDPPVDDVVARARRWRGDAVLAAGVRDTWRTLGLTERGPLVEWAEAHREGRVDRALLRAAHGPARGYTSQLTSLLAIRGVRDRAAFVRAIAWPSPEYRAARHLGPLALVGSGLRRARRG